MEFLNTSRYEAQIAQRGCIMAAAVLVVVVATAATAVV